MAGYVATIDVARPVDEVWAYVADLARHGEWADDDLTVTPEGEDFRSVAKAKGKEFTAVLRVTADREPPKRFGFSVSDATGEWQHEFTFQPIAMGTRVTRSISPTHLSPGQRVLYALVLFPVKKPSTGRSLAKLKERLEQPVAQ